MLQETLPTNKARTAEIERQLGNQLQELSSQFKEILANFNCDRRTKSEGTARNNHLKCFTLEVSRRMQTTIQVMESVLHYTKLDFPTFDGSKDPLIWLHRCEKFFTNQHMPERDKVGLTTFHMLGEAQLWYHQLKSKQSTFNQTEFKDYCSLRFRPPAESNSLEELVNLKQE